MSAGLPAAGLGGALYLLLIVWMLVRELTRTANGLRSDSRWPLIGKMVFVSVAMVLAIVGERLVISNMLKAVALYMPGLAKFTIVPSGSFVFFMSAMPFVILLMLIACLHCLRFWCRLSKTQPQGRSHFAWREADNMALGRVVGRT